MKRDERLTAGRILVVDDQTANVEVLARILQREGFRNVKAPTTPARHWPMFTQFQPDLILLDLVMPHLDGVEVIELLRPHIPASAYLPILVLTADSTAEAMELRPGPSNGRGDRSHPSQAMGRNRLPLGLRAREIPLSGRIVAVADVFDALTTNASACSIACGDRDGTETITWWTCMSRIFGGSSATIPADRGTSAPCEGWGSVWGEARRRASSGRETRQPLTPVALAAFAGRPSLPR